MSTIPPVPPPLPPVPAGGAAAVAVVVVGAAPAAILALPQGALIDVTLLARAARGLVEVRTDAGTMALKLPADLTALPGGTRMVLQAFQSGGETQFRIVSLNGRPILPGGVPLVPTPANLPAAPASGAGVQAGPSNPAAAGTAAAAALPQSAPAVAPAGIVATMLRPAVPPGTSPPPATPPTAGLPVDLPPGTRITVRILGMTPPLPQQAAVPTQPTPSQPLPAAAGAPPAPPAPAAAAQPPALPAAPPAAGGTPAPAVTLTGTVIAHPPAGNAVVQTPTGTLSLPLAADLAVGAQVTLEVIGKPLPPPTPATLAAAPQGLTAGGWPALGAAVDALARTDAQVAEQFLNAIPQANARLAASLALFAGALRSGDARQIVTDAVVRGLERAGKRDVGERLKGDIDKLAAESNRPLAGGEWRALTLPFLGGGQIEPIHLYLRRPDDDEAAGRRGGGGDGQRFVLEVAMTRLGRVQLDGLVRREDKQFDLIVRTETALPEEMRRDIMAIFAENAEICGTKGMVAFHPGRFVELPPPAAAPTALTV